MLCKSSRLRRIRGKGIEDTLHHYANINLPRQYAILRDTHGTNSNSSSSITFSILY
ncbi:MAG: hypothetical protein ACK4FV_07530 [Candidatus Nitrosocaldus sp.]